MLVWENCNMEAYTPKHGIFGQDAFVCFWLCEQHKLKDFESYKNNFRNPQEVKAQNTRACAVFKLKANKQKTQSYSVILLWMSELQKKGC